MFKNIEYHIVFTLKDLNNLKEANALIDVKNGGLLMGELHSTFGVQGLTKFDNNKWEISVEMEGWEYIMNPMSTKRYFKEISMINNEFNGSEKFENYIIPENIKVLDAQPIDVKNPTTGKLLLFSEEPQFVVNKNSTKKYLSILNDMNKQ